jgi:hypothetical protein
MVYTVFITMSETEFYTPSVPQRVSRSLCLIFASKHGNGNAQKVNLIPERFRLAAALTYLIFKFITKAHNITSQYVRIGSTVRFMHP